MALNYKSSLTRYRQYMQSSQNAAVVQASMFTMFSLVLLIVLVAFALRPTLSTIAGLFGQIKEQRLLEEQLSAKSLAVQEASALLQQTQPRLGVLKDALPSQPDWSVWVTSVEQIATASSVEEQLIEINGVQIVGTASAVLRLNQPVVAAKPLLPAGVNSVPFTIMAKGTFAQLKEFGRALEQLRRVAVLSEAGIVKEKDGTLTGTFIGVIGYSDKLVSP